MEDVHICIDNLPLYLGENPDVPSPGAYYGVSSTFSSSIGKRMPAFAFIIEIFRGESCVVIVSLVG